MSHPSVPDPEAVEVESGSAEYTKKRYLNMTPADLNVPLPPDRGDDFLDPLGFDGAPGPNGEIPGVPVFDAQPEDMPPVAAGAVEIALDFPLSDGSTDVREAVSAISERYRTQYNVQVDLMFAVGPTDVPVIRMSGYHENLREALAEYFGDQVQADEAYRATVIAAGVGNVVAPVEAHFTAYGDNPPEFRHNPEGDH